MSIVGVVLLMLGAGKAADDDSARSARIGAGLCIVGEFIGF